MVVYADEKELAKRINRVGFEDIMDMEYNTIFWLIHRFSSEYLVRLLCSRGENKWEMGEILSLLKKVHKEYYDQAPDYFNKQFPPDGEPRYFFHIAFDIATNSPLLPDEEENADEESPLPNPNSSPSGEAGRGLLEARIAELEKENKTLKEQVELCKNKEKGTALGLNQAQAALFGESLANTFQFNYTNKKKQLAPMLHKLFGWGQTKLETCLSTPCEREERDELANLFKELCPPLYDTIMNRGKLPQ